MILYWGMIFFYFSVYLAYMIWTHSNKTSGCAIQFYWQSFSFEFSDIPWFVVKTPSSFTAGHHVPDWAGDHHAAQQAACFQGSCPDAAGALSLWLLLELCLGPGRFQMVQSNSKKMCTSGSTLVDDKRSKMDDWRFEWIVVFWGTMIRFPPDSHCETKNEQDAKGLTRIWFPSSKFKEHSKMEERQKPKILKIHCIFHSVSSSFFIYFSLIPGNWEPQHMHSFMVLFLNEWYWHIVWSLCVFNILLGHMLLFLWKWKIMVNIFLLE